MPNLRWSFSKDQRLSYINFMEWNSQVTKTNDYNLLAQKDLPNTSQVPNQVFLDSGNK